MYVRSPSAETILWQKVIERAVIDAMSNPTTRTKLGTLTTEWLAKRDAIRWFERPGRDFKEVCLMAGIDPDFLIEKYRQGAFLNFKATRGPDA